MDLTGDWLGAIADDDLRRSGLGLDADDAGWTPLRVPGHWRNAAAFAESDGPVLYRRRFQMEPPGPGRRRWVTFEGLFYQGDVWLDGAYLGDPEGYFSSTAFDITSLCALGDDHVLAVEVACPAVNTTKDRRTLTGAYQGPDGIDPSWNPGGFAGPVEIVETGPVRIERFRVLCRDADATRAHVLLALRLDADVARTVRLRTMIDGRSTLQHERTLGVGANEVVWTLDVDDPALWWPHSLGEQPLTEISVEVLVDGAISDTASRRTGLREIAWSNWVCSVNGERLFLKGANLLPIDRAPADTPAERSRDMVHRALETGLDAVRINGHIADPQLYRSADEAGLLILQDFPLQGSQARSVRSRAVMQARDAVDRLGHHPSIALWWAHDDPDEHDRPGAGGLGNALRRQLPSWNRTVLDRWVKRTIEDADPTRPCVAHSGVFPHLPQLDGTDTHLWLGWHRGEPEDLVRLARRLPRLVRFVSEFGAQSLPMDPSPMVDVLDDPARYGADQALLDRIAPRAEGGDLAAWAQATHEAQAHLVRVYVETLRRLKYRPTGGFCVHSLNDPTVGISTALVDHAGVAKPAWDALRRACAPVIVVADQPPATIRAGDTIGLDVHIVSDLRTELTEAVVTATIRWGDEQRSWRFTGTAAADDCTRVGRIQMRAPAGAMHLDLALTCGEVTAHNSYRVVITAS